MTIHRQGMLAVFTVPSFGIVRTLFCASISISRRTVIINIRNGTVEVVEVAVVDALRCDRVCQISTPSTLTHILLVTGLASVHSEDIWTRSIWFHKETALDAV